MYSKQPNCIWRTSQAVSNIDPMRMSYIYEYSSKFCFSRENRAFTSFQFFPEIGLIESDKKERKFAGGLSLPETVKIIDEEKMRWLTKHLYNSNDCHKLKSILLFQRRRKRKIKGKVAVSLLIVAFQSVAKNKTICCFQRSRSWPI